jgi:hypothetical protein
MKLLIGITAAVLMATSAQAADFEEPRSISKYFDDPMPSSPKDRVNWALRARGEPPLGSSRVLHDNDAGNPVSRSTITHIHEPTR